MKYCIVKIVLAFALVSIFVACTKQDTSGAQDIRKAFAAIDRGDTQELSSLLGSGLSPNTKTAYNGSLLERAVLQSQNDLVQVLISHGADVNDSDRLPYGDRSGPGPTPLITALAVRNCIAAMQLLNAGADPSATYLRAGEDANAELKGLTALEILKRDQHKPGNEKHCWDQLKETLVRMNSKADRTIQ